MRPNVIFITTDQQRTDSIGCYGSSFARTPALDEMARQGVRFDRAYCTNPVCTPSRATILGGKYPSRHGAWNVGMNVPEDEVLLSHRLRALGYRTHLVGKAHLNSFGADPRLSMESLRGWRERYPAFRGPYYGFDEVELALGHATWGIAGHYGSWVESRLGRSADALFPQRMLATAEFGGEAYDWDIPVELHSSAWVADRTCAFLAQAAGDGRPFFLSVGFEDPHHPHAVPTELARTLDPARIPAPRYQEGELDDKPPLFRAAREGTLEQSPYRGAFPVAGQWHGYDFRRVPPQDARLGRAYYHGMVELVDRAMGRILETLARTGLDQSTLVVFTTDHGELLGDHGLWMKGPFHYEELVRVPLIIQLPGHVAAGTARQSLVSLADLVPTALSAADAPIPDDLDGADLVPLLRRDCGAVHDQVFVECVDDPKAVRLKTVVTARYKLTHYHGQGFGELYDLQEDPGELVNRWADPELSSQRMDLLRRIIDFAERLEKRAPRDEYA